MPFLQTAISLDLAIYRNKCKLNLKYLRIRIFLQNKAIERCYLLDTFLAVIES